MGGGSGGFVGSTTAALLSGKNLNDALQDGYKGAISGAALGGLIGGVQGAK